ncbi:protein trichome berefringence-like 7 isoform X2 [Hevea brasiliensis]|uniref:protein trichome berefringence-like 7 isoform X2 n=1 Tax=Hevea brasiliensis TaxID=3981 RepID=UPI0025E54565|nr:protein trichome berefringence-like 7 isoform X2 [Hevea brasiliensis]
MTTFNRSKSFNQKALGVGSPRSLSFGTSRINRSSSVSHCLRVLVVIGSLFSFFIAIGGGYIYVLPSFTQAFHGYGISKSNDSIGDCNVFDGNWIVDNSYPLYNASECPFVEQGFNCLGNGRKDEDYLKWRWKPKNCDIPRFNIYYILTLFQNKRIVFVGDSMSRSQWESLICLLMTGVEDKKSVYEVNRNKITKRIRYLSARFNSFNFTIEFFRSVFLVQHAWMPRHAPKRVRSTLRLDKMDDISSEWVNSDVLIFNTGHWWVPGKLFETNTKHKTVGSENLFKNSFSVIMIWRTNFGTIIFAIRCGKGEKNYHSSPGLLFPGWECVEAWNVDSCCLQNGTGHLGIMGTEYN